MSRPAPGWLCPKCGGELEWLDEPAVERVSSRIAVDDEDAGWRPLPNGRGVRMWLHRAELSCPSCTAPNGTRPRYSRAQCRQRGLYGEAYGDGGALDGETAARVAGLAAEGRYADALRLLGGGGDG